MKKQLIILAITIMASIGTHISAATVSWQDESKTFRVIDNKVIINHTVGQEIVGQYNEQELNDLKITSGKLQILSPRITARLSYKEDNKFPFHGDIRMTLRLSNGKELPLNFTLFIDNVLSSGTFDKNIEKWANEAVNQYIFKEEKTLGVDKAEAQKLLTTALQKATAKWKELIIGFKTDSNELITNLQKSDISAEMKALLEQGKAKLQKLKDLLTKF